MYIEKLASSIRNDVVSGLRGYHQNLSMNMAQLEDEVVACRLSIIHQYFLKGILLIEDLLLSINCIKVDCNSIEQCQCFSSSPGDIAHFQIPQIITYYGKDAIRYIGSTDKQNKFKIISSLTELQTAKYKKRGRNKPIVWVNYQPNADGMLDCYLFNAPFISEISIIAAFKDPRQLKHYNCCNIEELEGPDTNMSFIDQLVKDKLTKEKLYFYRQVAAQNKPNTQEYTTG